MTLPKTDQDTKIIYHAALYIRYEQIILNNLYKQYLETAFLSKKVFRMNFQSLILKKSYALVRGAQSHNTSFEAANRQFDWLEIYLVYDKNDQHNSIYDSYNAELAAKVLEKINVESITNTYSVSNNLAFDGTDKDQ